MSSNIVFFSVHVEDLPRAQRFYGTCFRLEIRAMGPAGVFSGRDRRQG